MIKLSIKSKSNFNETDVKFNQLLQSGNHILVKGLVCNPFWFVHIVGTKFPKNLF